MTADQKWKHRINLIGVWKNPDLGFEQRRDEIVRRLRASAWFRQAEEGGWLHQIVEELADSQSPDEFDGPWSAIYDEADADKVWIER
ncbi:hypothetical protein AB0I95_15125 [Micromonospora sp. NPDC049751]|uniref:hypothetical protein n=1 Tax=Micromonospora sp. NPDC049751 TaxID=3154837 RepID=UPI003410B6BA